MDAPSRYGTGIDSIVVTGATGGVGKAIVSRLRGHGLRVFATARRADALTGGDSAVELDLTDLESIERARGKVAAAVGGSGLQGLVNNAGISVDGPVELLKPDELRRQFEVNVFGQVAVTQAFLPLLRQGQGRVVFIGGAAGRLPLPMRGALSASKAAVDALSTALRMELKHQGVDVSYVEPGALRTDFFERSAAEARSAEHAGDEATQRRYAKAIELANKSLAETRTRPTDAVAGVVLKALTARRPSARYVIGAEIALGLQLLPHLPVALRDRILMSSVGLGPSAFTSDAGG